MAYQRALEALDCLRSGPVTVGAIAEKIPVSRPAVSQHLRALKEAGLVSDWVSGTRHFYQVDERGVEELRAWLALFSEEGAGTKVKRKRATGR